MWRLRRISWRSVAKNAPLPACRRRLAATGASAGTMSWPASPRTRMRPIGPARRCASWRTALDLATGASDRSGRWPSRVDHQQAETTRGVEHRAARRDGRSQQRHVVAEGLAEAARLQEVALHVDDDQRAVVRGRSRWRPARHPPRPLACGPRLPSRSAIAKANHHEQRAYSTLHAMRGMWRVAWCARAGMVRYVWRLAPACDRGSRVPRRSAARRLRR